MRVAMIGERSADHGIRALAAALAVHKHEVTVHILDGALNEFVQDLGDRWHRRAPDLVHAHALTPGLAAVLATDELTVPLVQTMPGFGTEPHRRRLERVVCQHARRIVATCTPHTRRLTAMGIPRERISLVPQGLDLDLFTPVGRRAPIGAAHRIVAAGRLSVHNRFDLAITALRGLADTELLIAGGPLEDNPELDRLKRCARQFGVADRVHFVGVVEWPRMPEVLRSADVVVCTPWYEGFGMVAVEAMACGVPVVATPIGGLADTVVHEVTGLHVPPRRQSELVHALRKLLADRALRQAYGTAGRDRALARFAWDRIATDISRAYLRASTGCTRRVTL